MEQQRRNGLNLIMLQLTTAEKTQQHWVSDILLILPYTYSLCLMASLLSIPLTSLFNSYVYTVTLTFNFVVSSPLSLALSMWRPPLQVLHSNQPLYVLSDALWLSGRLRVADKVNPVNMARGKAILKGTITTKLAHRVPGMEVHVLFIFCALGSAAIPHVS